MNVVHHATKTPLNLFFVDLEPAKNNKDIFDLKYIHNMKIAVEPPRKSTNIVQCTRCQLYNHTKSYCTRPFSCVKCGRGHSSTSCTKSRDLPAKCALCEGPHPANYKGCTVYKELQKQPPHVNEGTSLMSFLQEFKAMFSQLMSQNTMIINMLQTVISSLVQK